MINTQSNKTVFVFSLGQLTNSSVTDSIGSFAGLWAEKAGMFKSIVYPFCWLGSAAVYGYDLIKEEEIEKFKKGETTPQQFRQYLRRYYDEAEDSKIDSAWNKLCQIDEKVIENVISLQNVMTKDENIRVLVVSVTNPINAEYIQSALAEKVEGFPPLGRVQFALSYEQKTTSLTQITTTALSQNYEGYEVVSLHNAMTTAASIGTDPECFQYRPYNPSIGEKLGDVIQGVMQQSI